MCKKPGTYPGDRHRWIVIPTGIDISDFHNNPSQSSEPYQTRIRSKNKLVGLGQTIIELADQLYVLDFSKAITENFAIDQINIILPTNMLYSYK
jgi:hypothetical protein